MATNSASGMDEMARAWWVPQAPYPISAKRTLDMARPDGGGRGGIKREEWRTGSSRVAVRRETSASRRGYARPADGWRAGSELGRARCETFARITGPRGRRGPVG